MPQLTFNPHPLARNAHFQTTAPRIYRLPTLRFLEAAQAITLETKEGVRLQGYYSPQPLKQPCRGLVLLLHGWLGCVTSSYIKVIGEQLYGEGFAIFRLNFRDHGNTSHLNPGVFRSDLLDEVFEAAEQVTQLEPEQPFYVVGASLGGNFALRLAWRHSYQPLPNLTHTIGINPAIAPKQVMLALDYGMPLYLAYFRWRWRGMFRQKQQLFPHLYDFSDIIAARTSVEMTERFIRRYSPYPTMEEYLDSYAVTPGMMYTLQTPVTIITAADDPIVPVSDFAPLEKLTPYLKLHIVPHGGHVGFMELFPLRPWLGIAVAQILGHKSA